MSDYFKVDISRLSYAEAWRWGGLPNLLLLGVWKLLGVKRYGRWLVPATSGIVRVDPKEVTQQQHAAIEPMLRELRRSGFEVAFFYRAPTNEIRDGFVVAAINRPPDTMGQVAYSKLGVSDEVSLSLVSVAASGRFLATGSGSRSFSAPPEIDVLRLPRSPVREIVVRHAERVEQLSTRPIRITAIEPLICDLQTVMRNENVRRGLYVPA